MTNILWRPTRRACIILCLILASSTVVAANEAVETLAGYFDLLATGNLESASGMWTQAAIERSSRFGIEYSDIPLKIDCASPIVRNLELMRNHLQPPAKQIRELPGGDFFRLQYSAIAEGKLVEHSYYAYFDGSYYWLTYPQDYFCRDWKVKESEYFRIHAHPDVQKYLNPAALDEADQFVERLADSLDLLQSDLKTIREKKIEYYYCGSDETVREITGVRTKGTFDLPSNDIISSLFPHYHEVAHLMVNVKLGRLPLATHPLLREGLAVYYGGRRGNSSSALMGLGAFLHRKKIVEIDSLLTVSSFDSNASSDIAYPVAGLFTAYLLDKIGHKKYLEHYRALSGSLDEVRALPDSAVRSELLAAVDMSSWAALLSDFNTFMQQQTTERGPLLPGRIENAEPLMEADGFAISSNKEWLVFEFTANNSQPPGGNLLFGYDARLSEASSVMFEEQYVGKLPFEGHRFGVRFDANEAGLYDYAGNHVLAKYILGITPSDEYFDPDQNKITIRLKKSLVGDKLPSENDCKLVPL